MSTAHLISGGSAEYHLIIKTLPILRSVLDFPQRLQGAALSDDTILERLEVALLTSNPRICVIFDAESRAVNQLWGAMRMLLRRNGYENLPEQFPSNGIVCEVEERPRIGIWIMPDNEGPGMIEDFYLLAISPDNLQMRRARSFVESIPNDERLFGARVSKATFAVWLGIQADNTSPGQAVERNLILREAGRFPQFVAWLRDLFREEFAVES
jgi:hypothetical protein